MHFSDVFARANERNRMVRSSIGDLWSNKFFSVPGTSRRLAVRRGQLANDVTSRSAFFIRCSKGGTITKVTVQLLLGVTVNVHLSGCWKCCNLMLFFIRLNSVAAAQMLRYRALTFSAAQAMNSRYFCGTHLVLIPYLSIDYFHSCRNQLLYCMTLRKFN